MTEETSPKRDSYQAESDAAEDSAGEGAQSERIREPDRLATGETSPRSSKRRRLLGLGRRTLDSAARAATRVSKSPRAQSLMKRAGEQARSLGGKARDSTERAVTRIRASSPRVRALVDEAADQARSLGRKARESSKRTAAKVRESAPKAGALVDRAADHARALGHKAKDSTGRAATRLWESTPNARALIGETLKSTAEVISPSTDVPDQPRELPPGPKRRTESALDLQATPLLPTTPANQDDLVAPHQSADTPADADLSADRAAIGSPLSAVQPLVSTIQTSLPAQRALDIHHLKLLSYFCYGTSGLWALSLILALPGTFLGFFTLGLWNFFAGSLDRFLGGCILSSLYSLSMPILLVLAGGSLARHRRYVFCIVVASLACFSLALGTILGIASLIVLLRPTVRQIFSEAGRQAPPAALPVAPALLDQRNAAGPEAASGSMTKSPPGSAKGDS